MRKLLPIILQIVFLALGTFFGLRTGTKLPQGPMLNVFYLNVGEGGCALAQTPEGRNVLIDTGPEDAGPAVVQFLKSHGVRSLDLLVMTHPHPDRIGGVSDVLEAFPVKRVLDNAYPIGSRLQRRILDQIDAKRIPYHAAEAGQTLRVGKKLDVRVLMPGAKFLAGTEDDIDNNSVVLQLVYNRIKFLFPGDIREDAEGRLIDSEQDISSGILNIGSYGTIDDAGLEFLRTVRPDFVIVSAGSDDDSARRHRRALEMVSPENLGSELYRTEEDGTVAVRTDGKTVVVETEK